MTETEENDPKNIKMGKRELLTATHTGEPALMLKAMQRLKTKIKNGECPTFLFQHKHGFCYLDT